MDTRVAIILNIYRASNLLERVGRDLVSEVGLSSVQQWFILGELYRKGERSLKDFTYNLLVTKQNITGMIKRLKEGGYVTTREDADDRRITRVKLTDLGTQTVERLIEAGNASNESTFKPFTGEELGRFADMLERLVGNLHPCKEEGPYWAK
ncbi:MarR family transcriptional regulator [Paenibacillus sp. sptzw28]|uniref:MarR family winged helix-turn-helix transcriptional regulator n=1 Tax=Paenibacillus sp. sptzw28 TaxID=715179 RepID=UPI001C6E62D3|nr:MarR family transcriptional regulator [Paenibacillus sp. sptzw28]QYR21596.1 MarR family transcriptional regulator [Paenibacillus sp. sptzw28]